MNQLATRNQKGLNSRKSGGIQRLDISFCKMDCCLASDSVVDLVGLKHKSTTFNGILLYSSIIQAALQAQMKCEQLSTDGLAGILASIDQNQGKESTEVLQSNMKRRVYIVIESWRRWLSVCLDTHNSKNEYLVNIKRW